jgi:hypothetical protein
VVGIPAKPINKQRPAEPRVAAPQSIP